MTRADVATRFKPGQVANPHGRPMHARQKLGEKFIADLGAAWQEHGAQVIAKLVAEDPATLAKLVAQLLPKELAASLEVRQVGSLTREQREVCDAILGILERTVPPGMSQEAILTALEDGLRAEFARPVLPACPLPLPK